VKFSGSVELVIGSTLTIRPVKLRNCSSMQRDSERSNNPWYLLAFMFEEDFVIKKNERKRPRKTPIKIDIDKASI
jgi:hypothetical protein